MSEKFSVLSGGVNMKHPPTYKMIQNQGIPSYVALSIKSNALFDIDGTQLEAKPNHAIIIDRDTPYTYGNPDGYYINDWFRFQVSSPSILSDLEIPLNTLIPLSDPNHIAVIYQEILWEFNYSRKGFKHKNTSLLINVLFNRFASNYLDRNEDRIYSPFYSQLRDIRLDIQSNELYHYYTADIIAKQIGISTSYFQHIYKNLFGISFQKDLINMRVSHAKHLISNTDLPLKEVSELCGYSSEVHFYRQFKQLTGLTPSNYRNINL